MVEQLGLATMPPSPRVMESTAPALTSGMQSGTPSVMRKAELLSTTWGAKQHLSAASAALWEEQGGEGGWSEVRYSPGETEQGALRAAEPASARHATGWQLEMTLSHAVRAHMCPDCLLWKAVIHSQSSGLHSKPNVQQGHTVHLALEAMGPNFLLMLPPALKRATFMPLKLHASVR